MAELENEHRKSCPNHLRALLRFHWTLRCLQRRYKYNLVPRALFPGFGGGAGKGPGIGPKAPPPKPGKSALGTRLLQIISIAYTTNSKLEIQVDKFSKCELSR